MDINSGAVHIVDPVVYDALDHMDGRDGSRTEVFRALEGKYSFGEIEEALDEIDELTEEGMLFTVDSADMSMLDTREPVIKAMCLHVAHDCNMRCEYCFGDKGAFHGDRGLLSLETGKRAIDFLIENSGNRHNLEIDFFGGEPLLNFEVIRQLVEYGRSVEKDHRKNIRFTVTTNGLLLDDEKIDYIDENMVNVILSIDGRPEVNDRMRHTVTGKGTYGIITDNYKRFIKKREDRPYYVRGTFTGYNLDFANDVRHLLDQGFRNVSVEPVVTPEEQEYSIRESDLETILQEYDRLAEMYLNAVMEGRPFQFFHFNVDLNQGPCLTKRVSGCGAGTEYVAVSPEGDIYPCHQFVGEEQFRLGNVHDSGFKNRLFDDFKRAHVYSQDDCRGCWAKFYCSGGCHANAFHENGDLMKPYRMGCAMEKKRLECAIGIQAYLADHAQQEGV